MKENHITGGDNILTEKDKKDKKKFGNITYNEEQGLVSMSFNPIDVFKKSTKLKGDMEEDE